MAVPGRHHQHVVFIEANGLAFDGRFGAAAEAHVHRAVGAAVRPRLETCGNQLGERRHGRHRRAAGGRVDVALLVAEVRIGRTGGYGLQRGQRAFPGINKHLGRLGRLLVEIDRNHVGAVTRQRIAFRPDDGLVGAVAFLRKSGIEETHDGNVQTVEPYHRLVAQVAMVVPGPGRRDDEVAAAHRRAFAIDRGVGTLAVQHQTQRGLRVAMGRRHFARHDELQAGIQRLRDAGLAAQRGIFQDEHAALSLGRAYQRAGLHHTVAHVGVLPQVRDRRRFGRVRHQRAQHFPQGRHAVDANALVIGFPPELGFNICVSGVHVFFSRVRFRLRKRRPHRFAPAVRPSA